VWDSLEPIISKAMAAQDVSRRKEIPHGRACTRIPRYTQFTGQIESTLTPLPLSRCSPPPQTELEMRFGIHQPGEGGFFPAGVPEANFREMCERLEESASSGHMERCSQSVLRMSLIPPTTLGKRHTENQSASRRLSVSVKFALPLPLPVCGLKEEEKEGKESEVMAEHATLPNQSRQHQNRHKH